MPQLTYSSPSTPWAPPGSYIVRLNVDGKSYSQPMKLVLDPRVKTPASVIAQVSSLSREMYDGAVALRAAYANARAMSARMTDARDAALKARIDSIAPIATRGRGFGFGFGQAPAGPPSLESVRNTMMSAAMSMQSADVGPTQRQLDAVEKARAQYKEVMARWQKLAGAKPRG